MALELAKLDTKLLTVVIKSNGELLQNNPDLQVCEHGDIVTPRAAV